MAVVVQFVWKVASETRLTPSAIERLNPYITRYAQTMGVRVFAVGGADDHLHVLFDMPTNRSLETIEAELRKTTVRFLRDSLSLNPFAWSDEIWFVSVSPDEIEDASGYILENAARHETGNTIAVWESGEETSDEDAMPDWLRSAARGNG